MELIVLFVDVCLFKKGPQDVPASRLLLGLALVAYWSVGIALLSLQNDWLQATAEALTESVLLMAFVWATLLVANRLPRLLQTSTTLLATDALISLPGALLLSWWLARPEAVTLQIGLIGLTLWHLAVIAQVLRLAVSRPLVVGVALAVTYVGLSYTIMTMLFGGTPA
ncbi:MAG: hypothetical protein FJ189_06015 [Gammaproteobacteria bacterium]|nr:hypothetical protein [Gammaproteobacteria bacterium]